MDDTTTLTFSLPPQPDSLLSPQDIEALSECALRSLLEDHRKALDHIDDIWSTLRQSLNLIRVRREEYQNQRRLLLARTTPMNLLPNEVLAAIFAYVVHTYEWDPVALWKDLTHVCQRWRRIAQNATKVTEGKALTLDNQNYDRFPDLTDRLRYRCSIPGHFSLKFALQVGHESRPVCKSQALSDMCKFLSEPHKAEISLTMDGSTSTYDIMAAKIFSSSMNGNATNFPRLVQLTLRTPGHALPGTNGSDSNVEGIDMPILQTLWLQSSLVDFSTILQHRNWLFRPQNAQAIRQLKLDHVAGDFLRNILEHLPNLRTLRIGRLALTDDQEPTQQAHRRNDVTLYRISHPTVERFAITPDPFELHNFNLTLDCPSLSALCVSNVEPTFVTNLHPSVLTCLSIHCVNLPPSFTSLLSQFVCLCRLKIHAISHEDLLEFTNAFTRPQSPLFASLSYLVVTYRGSTHDVYEDKMFDEKLELPMQLGRLSAPRESSASQLRVIHVQYLDHVTASNLRLMVGVLNGWDNGKHHDMVVSFDEEMKQISTYLDEKDFRFNTLYDRWSSFTNKYQDVDSTFIMATMSTRKDGRWDGDYLHNQIWFLTDQVTKLFSGTKYADKPWKAITDVWRRDFLKACRGKGWMISRAAKCMVKAGKHVSTGNYDGLYYGERMGSLIADAWFRDEDLGF